MENELDPQESENPVEEETTLESNEEEVEETNEELTKAQEVAKNQKIRAEKAEKELKALKGKKPEPVEKQEKTLDSNYSLQDIRALEGVHDEDVKDVEDFAKYKGISLAEAKKDPVVVNILKTKTEERATADATNTGKGKRGSKATNPQDVVDRFHAGKDVDPVKAAQAEHDLKMAKLNK